MHPHGRIINDPEAFYLPESEKRGVPVKLRELAQEAGDTVMANTVAVGAILVLLGLDTEATEKILKERFAEKEEVASQNIAALKAGYDEAAKICSACFTLPSKSASKGRMFIDGNQVLGMAALASGCGFMTAYPMTPSTGIMNYLAYKAPRTMLIKCRPCRENPSSSVLLTEI